jgi:hypothetical protein
MALVMCQSDHQVFLLLGTEAGSVGPLNSNRQKWVGRLGGVTLCLLQLFVNHNRRPQRETFSVELFNFPGAEPAGGEIVQGRVVSQKSCTGCGNLTTMSVLFK